MTTQILPVNRQLCHGYIWNEIISACWSKLNWTYFKIISQPYYSSCICFNMFIVSEI